MVKSTVVDNETGKSIDSTVRTSTGTFFARQARPPGWLPPCCLPRVLVLALLSACQAWHLGGCPKPACHPLFVHC